MTDDIRKSLPPMGAIEFAIGMALRYFFFGLRLVLTWAVLFLPVLALAWFAMFGGTAPDISAPRPLEIAVMAAFAAAALFATFSIAVNWHRRVLLDERPRGLGWVRLDRVVWRYVFGLLLIILVMGLYAGAAYGVAALAAPALAPQLGPAAKPVAIVTAVLLGLSALFTLYRLSSWLAAIAVGDRGYTLKAAWRTTRRNRFAYLGFTFWLLFTLALAGGLGAGAFLAQQAFPEPWVKAAAFVFIGLLGWLSIFLVATVPASHYRHFALTAEEGGR